MMGCCVADLRPEVVALVLEHLPGAEVLSAMRVCRAWAEAAELALRRRCTAAMPRSARQRAALGRRPWVRMYAGSSCARCRRSEAEVQRGLFHVRHRGNGGVSLALVCGPCIATDATVRDALDRRNLCVDTLCKQGSQRLLDSYAREELERDKSAVRLVESIEGSARASNAVADGYASKVQPWRR